MFFACSKIAVMSALMSKCNWSDWSVRSYKRSFREHLFLLHSGTDQIISLSIYMKINLCRYVQVFGTIGNTKII